MEEEGDVVVVWSEGKSGGKKEGGSYEMDNDDIWEWRRKGG